MLPELVWVLTLGMVALHVGEWLLLGRWARAARGAPPAPSSRRRVPGWMNFLRLEAFYYLLLLAFWLFQETNLPGLAVFLLGAIHVGGWAALESKQALPALEALARRTAEPSQSDSRTRGVDRLLQGIAVFDAAEVGVLVYIAYRLWP
jgi:hypothetical protein